VVIVKVRPAVFGTLFFVTALCLNFLMKTIAFSRIHFTNAYNRLKCFIYQLFKELSVFVCKLVSPIYSVNKYQSLGIENRTNLVPSIGQTNNDDKYQFLVDFALSVIEPCQ